MSPIDVTKQVEFGTPDDELLPLTRCVCGQDFHLWDQSLSIYKDDCWQCPQCGRKLYFRNGIKVYMENKDE